MWEVGERYQQVHSALDRGNFDLAVYHWDEMDEAIDGALVRRPERRASAEGIFLSGVSARVREGFASQDPEQAWGAFELARSACMSCHVAEAVPFMSDQPMFDLRRPGL